MDKLLYCYVDTAHEAPTVRFHRGINKPKYSEQHRFVATATLGSSQFWPGPYRKEWCINTTNGMAADEVGCLLRSVEALNELLPQWRQNMGDGWSHIDDRRFINGPLTDLVATF